MECLPCSTKVISRPQIHWSKATSSLVTLVNNAVSLESLLTLSILQLWGSKTDYFDKYSSVAQLTTPTTTCIHRSSLTGLCAFIPFTTACHHTLLVSYVHVTVIPTITVAGIRDERRRKPKHAELSSFKKDPKLSTQHAWQLSWQYNSIWC